MFSKNVSRNFKRYALKKLTYIQGKDFCTLLYHRENRGLLKAWYSKTALIFYSTLKRNKSSIEAFFLNSKQRRI